MLQDFSGTRLKDLRKRARLTQLKVVEITGISESTICYLEKGTRSPQNATLQKLLALYAERIQYWRNLENVLNGDNHAQGTVHSQTPEWRRGSNLIAPSGQTETNRNPRVPEVARRP